MSGLPDPRWRVGFEVELMAPRGRTRRALADAIAAAAAGTVTPFFHPQSEPSKVPGTPIFHNLTPGFEVRGPDGAWIARCVDDLTLQADCRREAPPVPGWFRVVSDDLRLLHLVRRHGRPDGGIDEAVGPVAALFGTAPEPGAHGLWRVADETGAPVCLGAPLPGERERPCELITAPLERDHGAILGAHLELARGLGFFPAAEAAVHVHLDAAALSSARAMRALVRLWRAHADEIKRLVRTNPRCVRLGAWPDALLAAVEAPGFAELPWPEAVARLRAAKPTKYVDLNLANHVLGLRDKPTIELRVLPGGDRPEPMIAGALVGEALLRAAVEDRPADRPLESTLDLPAAAWAALR